MDSYECTSSSNVLTWGTWCARAGTTVRSPHPWRPRRWARHDRKWVPSAVACHLTVSKRLLEAPSFLQRLTTPAVLVTRDPWRHDAHHSRLCGKLCGCILCLPRFHPLEEPSGAVSSAAGKNMSTRSPLLALLFSCCCCQEGFCTSKLMLARRARKLTQNAGFCAGKPPAGAGFAPKTPEKVREALD